MTEILKAIIFGIVEGITEWLPISSTGHMILLNEFLTLDVSAQFWDMFLVVIQLGAILAVVVLFWNLIWPFARSSSEAVVAAGQNEKSGSLAKREYWVLGPVTVRMPVIGARSWCPACRQSYLLCWGWMRPATDCFTIRCVWRWH